MFKTRLLSGILLVIIALVTVITGGNLLFAVLLLISLIGMTELYKVFHIEHSEKAGKNLLCIIFRIGKYKNRHLADQKSHKQHNKPV